jgi:2-isopropylmalate synthase
MSRAANSSPERAASSLVRIYDTTLRDGTQGEGISLSLGDKLRIASRLDAFGVSFIEGGWPGSNPKDVEFFERAREVSWKHATIVAFGCTRRANGAAADDDQVKALLAAETEVVTIFGKTWTLHVTEVLRTTLDENLRMIEDTVAVLRAAGRRVIYDAEHFFDGFRSDSAYAVETLRAAKRGGAEVLTLCDTNGGSLPWDIEEIVRGVVRDVDHPLGIHTHDDSGCGVANALAAIRAGARQVQGTVNGYGERCGNANLCAVIPDLELKMNLRALPDGSLAQLGDVARFVAEIANLPLGDQMAYVGKSAFAHKGGVHVAAMRREATSYQHIDPALVGNLSRVVVSELSGRANVFSKAEELGMDVGGDTGVGVLAHIKDAESRGFAFEAAEASVSLLIRREKGNYAPPFEVIEYQVNAGQSRAQDEVAEATVKVRIGGEVVHTAAEGNGPVSALDRALRKALLPKYPVLAGVSLVDYKVRILDGGKATNATTRVLIDSRAGERTWSTVGASTNIVVASMQAIVDSLEYALHELTASPETRSARPGAPFRA